MEKPATTYLAGQLRLQTEPVENIFTTLVFNYAYHQLKSFDVADGVISNKVITNIESLYGTGLELGWMTRLGPAIFSTEYNFGIDRLNFALHLGYWF